MGNQEPFIHIKDMSYAYVGEDEHPHPVLKLIGHAASELRASGKGKLMGASGDLAIDPSLTESFLSLGVGFLSVSPPYVLEVRERIRNCP